MLALLWLIIALGAAALAVSFADWLPQIAVGACVVVWGVWVLTSVLSPAVPNRECPRCGQQGLLKIRRGEPGVRCHRQLWELPPACSSARRCPRHGMTLVVVCREGRRPTSVRNRRDLGREQVL